MKRSTNKTRVRFWIWFHQSPVRITLYAGKPIETCEGGPHDEGYSYSRATYSLEKDPEGFLVVVKEWESDGRDCDGRLTRHGICECLRPNLDQGYHDEEHNVVYPSWDSISRSQRDEYAEAMGY